MPGEIKGERGLLAVGILKMAIVKTSKKRRVGCFPPF